MDELEIEANGRVQGINFRAFIKRFCDKLELKGYVMNREEGSIFLSAQGQKESLKKLLFWINSSPGFSKIESLSYRWKTSTIKYNEFSIVKDKSFIVDQAKSIVNLGKFMFGKKKQNVPNHIAIIPDGNRRWAKEKGMVGSMGHYKAGSYENLESLFNEARKLGVKYMSIWGFSTENWKRDKKEVDAIFDLILKGIEKFRVDAEKNKIRFRHIGRKERLPKKLREELEKLEEETNNYRSFNVQLCLDYGGRDEIIRAINKIIKNGQGKVDEKEFEAFLDTKDIPDPDLIIRTSGEYRISGLMPYQGTYSELYFSDCYFPDFDVKELRKAIEEYSRRQRRFGGG